MSPRLPGPGKEAKRHFAPEVTSPSLDPLMHAQGLVQVENYRELIVRLSTALAMAEAAYVEARRRYRLLGAQKDRRGAA